MSQRKITSYHADERSMCPIHNCIMARVPCTMYVYCLECEKEKDRDGKT